MSLEVIEAKPYHCGQILRTLRDEHRLAITRTGFGAHRVLRSIFDESWFRKAVLADGKLIALGGVAGTPLSSEGTIWAAVSKEGQRYPIALIKIAKAAIAEVSTSHRNLVATVLAHDPDSRRFAEFLGFLIEKSVPLGESSVFVMGRAA